MWSQSKARFLHILLAVYFEHNRASGAENIIWAQSEQKRQFLAILRILGTILRGWPRPSEQKKITETNRPNPELVEVADHDEE